MSYLKDLIKDDRGSLTTLFGFSLSVMTIGMGIGMDLLSLTSRSNDAQYLADMAVLAAAASEKRTPWELQDIAESVVNGNSAADAGYDVTLTLNLDRSMTVQVSGEYDYQFLDVFGRDKASYTATAEAPPVGLGKLDLALVIDITDDSTGGLLSGLIETANDYVSTLNTGVVDIVEDNTEVRISVVPFSQYVKIPTGYEGEPWLDVPTGWDGCMGSRSEWWHKRPEWGTKRLQGFTAGGECHSTLQPLTGDLLAVKDAILSINTNENTYLPGGLVWGWRTLSRSVPLVEADTPDYHERRRAMVLVSDGGNTKSYGDDGLIVPGFGGTFHNDTDVNDANLVTAEVCQSIKDEGIIIYAVALSITDGTTLTLLENCATSPAKFLTAADDITLDLAFRKIGKDLRQVRLSR